MRILKITYYSIALSDIFINYMDEKCLFPYEFFSWQRVIYEFANVNLTSGF